jgi:adenosylhomocysteine nucleosidase
VCGSVISHDNQPIRVVVLISANQEWRAVRKILQPVNCETSPYGQWFSESTLCDSASFQITFMQSGWGKTKAAGSTQYAVDHFQPDLLVNLGTCGGFEGSIQVGDVILVEKTIMYDIYEQMIDPDEAIAAYSTQLDLSFLSSPYPLEVIQTVIVSGDRDLMPDQIEFLKQKYQAIAGDWESASVAFIAHANQVPCLILRGVTDLVSPQTGGEAYANIDLFTSRTEPVMQTLIQSLPAWLKQVKL